MTTEQPKLFAGLDNKPVQEAPFEYFSSAKPGGVPFLAGVEPGQAFTEVDKLADLAAIARECNRCPLRQGCQQVVFGEGNPDSSIMFIGEGPGGDEDRLGRPFVGRAGKLLDKILQAADFERSQVYIANVVKCRPPGNRLPYPDEVKICRNYLEAQIRILHPQIIVCLGSLASQVVIDPKAKISKVRGQWFSRQGINIMATYHPAALLRNEEYKRPAWQDFKAIRDYYKRITAPGAGQ
jgi:uracil-DNA glycosylase family 4